MPSTHNAINFKSLNHHDHHNHATAVRKESFPACPISSEIPSLHVVLVRLQHGPNEIYCRAVVGNSIPQAVASRSDASKTPDLYLPLEGFTDRRVLLLEHMSSNSN